MIDESRLALSKELLPGENLLWAGRPKQGILLRASDRLTVPSALVWTGFVIFFLFKVLTSSEPSGSGILILLFIFLVGGFYVSVGRLLIESRLRASTYYGLTEQSVIVVQNPRSRKKVNRVALGSVSDIDLEEYSDSLGTISFDAGEGSSLLHPRDYPVTSFECLDHIENPRSVFSKIMEAKQKLRSSQEKRQV
jgi:hypothetical protein